MATLAEVQEELDKRGIKDVKVFWGEEAHLKTKEELGQALADSLDRVLKGDYVEMGPLGDAPDID